MLPPPGQHQNWNQHVLIETLPKLATIAKMTCGTCTAFFFLGLKNGQLQS
jgi:hypothetical protein